MTLGLPLSTLYAFLLVLARVAGFVIFIPIPGFRNAPEAVRLLFALAITFTLFPLWPNLPNENPPFSQLAVWAFCEAGFGLAAGLAVAFLAETFQLGAQFAGFQAGYGFASTIDPNSQADSGILQVVASLSIGCLFFTTGFDHQLIRVLAASFEKVSGRLLGACLSQPGWHLTTGRRDALDGLATGFSGCGSAALD